MPRFIRILVACLFVFVSGCATESAHSIATAAHESSKLHQDFLTVSTFYQTTVHESGAWDELKRSIEADLRTFGDKRFAEALAKEPEHVRYAVDDLFGYPRNPSAAYPKTRRVLSVTPRI